MILAIEREWSKRPGWFVTLTAEQRTLLLADWQIRHKPKKAKRVPQQVKRIGRYV